MANNKLKAGDLVVLLSGSEPMTLGELTAGDMAMCYWSEGKKVVSKEISLAALKLYERLPSK
ncbi:MAG TPA: DUF2158 domain-containing protein [Bacteroidia bacterium]|nr:DUF2158 domain-containing protein [Bacteroidia bacterium]